MPKNVYIPSIRPDAHRTRKDWVYLIRKVNELHNEEGVPLKEAARRLGISVSQVYRHRAELRQIEVQESGP